LLWLAYERISLERKQRLKFQPARLLLRGLPIIIICLMIFVSIAYYYAPSVQNYTPNIKVPSWIIKASTQIVDKIIPELMPQSRDEINNIDQIISLIGFTENQADSETLEQAIELVLNKKINDFLTASQYVKYIPIALAVSLFFSLNILNLFLSWLIILISCIIVWILRKLKIVSLQKQSAEQEVLEF